MTKREILEKAIKRIIKNGYSPPKIIGKIKDDEGLREGQFRLLVDWYMDSAYNRKLILSHKFAKAFFGEKIIKVSLPFSNKAYGGGIGFGGEINDSWNELGGLYWKGASWKYHLQQIILAKDPLKYLEKFLS